MFLSVSLIDYDKLKEDAKNLVKLLSSTSKVTLKGDNIEFKFQNSTNGIQPFSFNIESGQMVGIMGGSGVGKSTLMLEMCKRFCKQGYKTLYIDVEGNNFLYNMVRNIVGSLVEVGICRCQPEKIK